MHKTVTWASCVLDVLQEVCYQYWPSRGSQTFGEFKVELLEQEKQTGFLIHKFAINHKKVKLHIMINMMP